MSTQRILFVDHTAALGGAELYLLDIARHFSDRCTVLLFEDGPLVDRLTSAGVQTSVLHGATNLSGVSKESGLFASFRAIPTLASLFRALGAHVRSHDVVFANSQKALIATGPVASCLSRPLIWSLHDLLSLNHFSWINQKVATRWSNAFANIVVVNSKATRTAYHQAGGRARTKVVYNGISPEQFHPSSDHNLRRLREELGIGSHSLVGVFSRLAPWKGQHVLLKALSDLPDVHLLLVGDALFSQDNAYANELRTLTDRLGLKSRVHFLGFRDDIPALMHLVDIVAHTSTAPEPFGRVIVEAMLSRTPVIATRAGGALEIVDDQRTGLLVKPEDPDGLIDAIHTLLNSPSLVEDMTARAYNKAVRRFSIEIMLDGINRVIKSVD